MNSQFGKIGCSATDPKARHPPHVHDLLSEISKSRCGGIRRVRTGMFLRIAFEHDLRPQGISRTTRNRIYLVYICVLWSPCIMSARLRARPGQAHTPETVRDTLAYLATR